MSREWDEIPRADPDLRRARGGKWADLSAEHSSIHTATRLRI
jgi:hypothetical protein